MIQFLSVAKRCASALALFSLPCAFMLSAQAPKHNVIIFVADGLRRGSVTAAEMPTFLKLRTEGVDFRNSHSVFPTFTTANASAIATGHALGDTGDFSNVIYPGMWLAQQNAPTANGSITPFLESDAVLADLNAQYDNNYLGQPTLLSTARAHGFNVASVGKLGPTAIQQVDVLNRDPQGLIQANDAIIIDDSTGNPTLGIPVPLDLADAIDKAGLAPDAPLRTNGYSEGSFWNNANFGYASIPGTRAANITQQQWFTDITTQVLLPRFAAEPKPFVVLFWSRDPDGTQHNQGDSLQNLAPGINGEASHRALQNADHCLKQILDWLDAHPAVKANTDVLVTSDHGFATISRREINAANDTASEPSTRLTYNLAPRDAQSPGTLPTGFLAIDLAIWSNSRLFDPVLRSDSGDSVYKEVVLSGEKADHLSNGNALISEHGIKQLDGNDARLIVAANGGSDLIYVPSHDPAIVRSTLETLRSLDYVGGLFVDDAFCAAPTDCPGALPLSAIALKGSSKLPRPTIVVAFKVFYRTAGDLQSGVQISDTTLQEGQGMHGGLGRESTWNNMAAIGPDFKHGFVDELPMGNIDIAPTLASILALDLTSHGDLRGRVLSESLVNNSTTPTSTHGVAVSAPDSSGARTILEYQESNGVRYYDRGCFITAKAPNSCGQ